MKISLRFSAVLSLSLAVLLCEPTLLSAILLSAFMHEIAHVTVIRLFGGRVFSLEILSGGCIIKRSPCTRSAELAVFAAGPCMNLVLWGIFSLFSGLPGFSGSFFRIAADASLSLAVFNLLPIRSQDGGCILRVLSCRFLSPAAAGYVCEICSLAALGVLWIAGIRLLLFYDFSSACFWFCLGAFYSFYVRSDASALL